MNLLLATDHRFLQYGRDVFDTYCFDRAFFHDYLQVFNSIEVCSRLVKTAALPSGAFRSDGKDVSFLKISDTTGFQWLLRARRLSQSILGKAVDHADAVIVRVPSQLGYWAAQLAQEKSKPYMIEVIGDPGEAILHAGRGLHYQLVAWWEMMRLRKLAKHAAVASYVTKYHLQAKYPVRQGTPNDNISSIRLPAVEITSARQYRPDSEILRIVFVASLLPYKRHADLIAACAFARNKGVATEIHFAGDGPLRQNLEMAAEKFGIREQVVFHGHIADRQQLLALLDSSDLFVIPSASEGLPRAVLEAMARGLPVIGSQVGGIPELIREPELFAPGDVEQLVKLIGYLFNNQAVLAKMSHYSIGVAKQYSTEVLSPRRQRLYRMLRMRSKGNTKEC